ncbi:hypothetical protein [Azotobacter armeniacus]
MTTLIDTLSQAAARATTVSLGEFASSAGYCFRPVGDRGAGHGDRAGRRQHGRRNPRQEPARRHATPQDLSDYRLTFPGRASFAKGKS